MCVLLTPNKTTPSNTTMGKFYNISTSNCSTNVKPTTHRHNLIYDMYSMCIYIYIYIYTYIVYTQICIIYIHIYMHNVYISLFLSLQTDCKRFKPKENGLADRTCSPPNNRRQKTNIKHREETQKTQKAQKKHRNKNRKHRRNTEHIKTQNKTQKTQNTQKKTKKKHRKRKQ